MFRWIDRQRDRAEILADETLEFPGPGVGEVFVVGVDAVDILVVRDHPVALRSSDNRPKTSLRGDEYKSRGMSSPLSHPNGR